MGKRCIDPIPNQQKLPLIIFKSDEALEFIMFQSDKNTLLVLFQRDMKLETTVFRIDKTVLLITFRAMKKHVHAQNTQDLLCMHLKKQLD